MVAYSKAGLSFVRDSCRGTGTLIARQVGHAGPHGVGTMAGNPGKTMVASLQLVEHVDCDKGKLSTSFISSRRAHGSTWNIRIVATESSNDSSPSRRRLDSVGIVGIVMCHHQMQPAFAVDFSTNLDDVALHQPASINPTL
jgi:hypothetical protein